VVSYCDALSYVLFRLAFVDFESVEDAKNAMENSNGMEIGGRNVKLDFAAEKGSGICFAQTLEYNSYVILVKWSHSNNRTFNIR